MAGTILVDEMIKAGEDLLRLLDQNGIAVGTAFWFFDRDAEDWRLILSMPMVDSQGTTNAYQAIKAAAEKRGETLPLYLRQIVPTSPKDELIKLIVAGLPTPLGAQPIRVMRSALRTVPIEDVYIYRST